MPLPKGALGGTCSGNAVACAASLAVMDIMQNEALTTWTNQQEAAIVNAYQAWKGCGRFPMLGVPTGIGAMRGIVFERSQV
ncbi:MAG: hypothetical protein R6W86_12650 [Marinobacter sp.]|uniref:hypothetical protein n=1 Tax=Marinobacter sp. TaxID=50741 RepID=UPI00396DE845